MPDMRSRTVRYINVLVPKSVSIFGYLVRSCYFVEIKLSDPVEVFVDQGKCKIRRVLHLKSHMNDAVEWFGWFFGSNRYVHVPEGTLFFVYVEYGTENSSYLQIAGILKATQNKTAVLQTWGTPYLRERRIVIKNAQLIADLVKERVKLVRKLLQYGFDTPLAIYRYDGTVMFSTLYFSSLASIYILLNYRRDLLQKLATV